MDVESLIDMVAKHDLNILYMICATYFMTAVLVFALLVYGITAPYGRYARAGWGLHVNGIIAWFVQEIPSFAVPLLFFFTDAPGLAKTPNLFFVVLFLIHYFQRSCIFPFLIKGGKPTPFVPFILALVFCVMNGYLQTAYLLYHATFPDKWWLTPNVLIGVTMFFVGMVVNIHSDHILRNLRKPGETGYKIPQGGMYNFVSGANFFGEMVEWAGFAIATWSLPALAFSVFTCCNIGPRAYQHHKYYLEKFEDYPKNRKAVIPFIL